MGVFVQQPAVRGLKTDWRWASLITYLASGAKGSEPPPLSAMKFLFSSIILPMYFNRLQKVVSRPDSTVKYIVFILWMYGFLDILPAQEM